MENFEKYLQEQADKFWMEPSAGTWGKIAERMEKEKKRRRLIWGIFSVLVFGLLFTALGWYLGTQHIKHSHTAKSLNVVDYKMIQTIKGNDRILSHDDASLNTTNYSNNGNSNNSATVYASGSVNNSKYTKKSWKNLSSNNWDTDKQNDQNQLAQNDNLNQFTTQRSENAIYDGLEKNNEMHTHQMETYSELKNENSMIAISENDSEQSNHTDVDKRDNNKEVLSASNNQLFVDTVNVKSKFTLNDPNRTKKWFVSAYFNGFATGSRFTDNPLDTVTVKSGEYVQYRSYIDKPRFGFTAGGSVGYSPIKYLSIELGFQYTEFTSLEKPLGYPDNNDPNIPKDPYPFYLSSYSEGQVFASNFQMLQIPLLFTFNWNWNKSFIHVTTGPVLSYTSLFKGYEVTNQLKSLVIAPSYSSEFVENWGIGIQSKLLYSYQILPNFSLYAGPTFQYRFNSVFNNAYIIRQNPYFIGLETGLRVHF